MLAYPPGWRQARGDAGTATATITGPGHRILGYLNLTPRQGEEETVANWPRFRVQHNAEEGDRQVTTQAAATGLRFRTGRGSCVRDSYTTRARTRYIEIACLVAGRRATSVVIGAAPPERWAGTAPLLEQAISALST